MSSEATKGHSQYQLNLIFRQSTCLVMNPLTATDLLPGMLTGCLTDQRVWFPVDFQEFPGNIVMKIQ